MNITRRPVSFKPEHRQPRDRLHLARVARLPCCICAEFYGRETRPVQVHHVIHDRHGTRRAPDRMTIPLCVEHHNALHANKTAWREAYGADHEWIAPTLDKLENDI